MYCKCCTWFSSPLFSILRQHPSLPFPPKDIFTEQFSHFRQLGFVGQAVAGCQLLGLPLLHNWGQRPRPREKEREREQMGGELSTCEGGRRWQIGVRQRRLQQRVKDKDVIFIEDTMTLWSLHFSPIKVHLNLEFILNKFYKRKVFLTWNKSPAILNMFKLGLIFWK